MYSTTSHNMSIYRYSSLTHDIVVQDASLSRTNTINYTLSSAELPSQFPFTLRVALEVYNVIGRFSRPSDPVDYLRKCVIISIVSL